MVKSDKKQAVSQEKVGELTVAVAVMREVLPLTVTVKRIGAKVDRMLGK